MHKGTFSKNDTQRQILRLFGLHALIIFLFIFYEQFLTFYVKPKTALQYIPFALPLYAVAIAMFYFNAHVVMKLWIYRKLRFLVVAINLIEAGIYGVFSLFITSLMYHVEFTDDLIWNRESMAKAFWRGIYFLGFSLTYWIGMRNSSNTKKVIELQRRELEQQKKHFEMENAYLRAQINPHFMKNTLHFVYANTQEHSEKAARAIYLLGQFVNYSYSDIEKDADQLVPLEAEMEQVKRYLEIRSLRLDGQLHIVFEEHNATGVPFLIPPMLLVTFLENIFTHGIVDDPVNPVIVRCELDKHRFHFRTENLKGRSGTGGKKIGLCNASARLEGFYPDRHRLEMTSINESFILDLEIFL